MTPAEAQFQLNPTTPPLPQGPFHLGAFSLPLGWVAVVWGCFISVVLILPTMYPITNENFNYAVRGRQLMGSCGVCRRVV